MTAHLRVLTFNCWGLKYVAEQRRERLLALAEWVAHSSHPHRPSNPGANSEGLPLDSSVDDYDLIALQEIWACEDYEAVAIRAKESGLLYSRFFFSGAIGAGLAVLSRYPILSSTMYPYQLNGYPLHFIEGDFYAGKGLCNVTIQKPGIGKIDVLSTHMYAPGGEGDKVDGAHRLAQAWELSKLVREKSESGRHVLVMGDLNSQPWSIIIRMLLSLGQLVDAFAQTTDLPWGPSLDSPEHKSLTIESQLLVHGITADSPLNTWHAPRLKKRDSQDEVIIRGGKRLDYVLYRSPANGDRLVAETCKVALTETIPGLGVSYSDHFGVDVIFSLLPHTETKSLSGRDIQTPYPHNPVELLSNAVSVLRERLAQSLSESRLQLQILGGCIFLIPAISIAASFQPLGFLNWIFTVLAILVGAVGVTMLYTGFVGGQWERGKIKNALTEMENEISFLEGGTGM